MIKLIAILIFLQIADIFLTNKALKTGCVEANPIMEFCQQELGKLWWVPKIIATVLVILLSLYLEAGVYIIWIWIIIYICICLNNIRVIRKGSK